MTVSAGFVAGIRGKVARLLAPFMDRVRELLHAAPVLYAGETPARAAGNLRYVHVACTEFLTAMHTGDRTSQAIDAGGILPGYAGTIVRDGYKGYEHLTDALHAWCGAHGLRDLAGLYRFDPDGQVDAQSAVDRQHAGVEGHVVGGAGGQAVARVEPLAGGTVLPRLDMAGQQHPPGPGRRGPQPAEHAPPAAVGQYLHGEHVLADPGRGQHNPLGLQHGLYAVTAIAG